MCLCVCVFRVWVGPQRVGGGVWEADPLTFVQSERRGVSTSAVLTEFLCWSSASVTEDWAVRSLQYTYSTSFHYKNWSINSINGPFQPAFITAVSSIWNLLINWLTIWGIFSIHSWNDTVSWKVLLDHHESDQREKDVTWIQKLFMEYKDPEYVILWHHFYSKQVCL